MAKRDPAHLIKLMKPEAPFAKGCLKKSKKLLKTYNSFLLSDINKSKKIFEDFKNQLTLLAESCETAGIKTTITFGKMVKEIAKAIDLAALKNDKADIFSFLDLAQNYFTTLSKGENVEAKGIYETFKIFQKSLDIAKRKGVQENKETVFIVGSNKEVSETLEFILLPGGFNVLKFRNQIEAFNSVSLGNIPELIILDLGMPKIHGFEMYGALQESSSYQMIPFLFLASKDERINAIAPYSDDYILKPVKTEELLSKVNLKIERMRIFNELIIRDSLTGAYNRRHFHERLQHEINRSLRHKLTFSIIMIDIDDFKKVNDSFGHPVGDKVLKFLVKFLSSNLRSYDLVSRFGGEEFALILSEIRKENSGTVIKKLCEKFATIPFTSDTCGRMFYTTISAGIASFPEDGESPEKLIDSADRALYHAKRTGKNKAVIFNSAGMM